MKVSETNNHDSVDIQHFLENPSVHDNQHPHGVIMMLTRTAKKSKASRSTTRTFKAILSIALECTLTLTITMIFLLEFLLLLLLLLGMRYKKMT